MTDTTYVDNVATAANRVKASWLNDLNKLRYGASDATKGANLLQFMAAGTGAVAQTTQDKARLWVDPEDYGAVGDGVTNDYAAFVLAFAASPYLELRPKAYNLGNNTLTPPTTFAIRGKYRRGTQLTRTGAGPVLTLPYTCQNSSLKNIYFTGVGNTGVTVAATAGTFQGYGIGLHIDSCDFAWELAYGLNFDQIFCLTENSDFGLLGTTGVHPAAGASTMIGIRSAFYPATTNYTNMNEVRNCRFLCGSSNSATPAVQLASGSMWKFVLCDFEECGVVFTSTDVSQLTFDTCWFERNVSLTDLIVIGGTAALSATFTRCYFTNNTTGANRGLWNYASTVPVSLRLFDNLIGKNAGTYCLYDNATTLRTLQGDGSVTFYNNTVTGDTVGDVCKTGTDFRGGLTSPRVVASIDTTGGVANLRSCSDPGATYVRNGAGDSTLTLTQPLGTAVNKIVVICTGRTGDAIRAVAVTTTTIQIQCFTNAGVATEGIVGVVAYGV